MKTYIFFLLVCFLVQNVVISNEDGTEPSNVPSPTAVSPKPPKPPSNNSGGGNNGGGGAGSNDDDFWSWQYGMPSNKPIQTPGSSGGTGSTGSSGSGSNGSGSSGGGGGSGSGSGSGSNGQDAIVGTSSFSFTYYMANTTMDCWGSTDSLALNDAAVVKAAALLLTNIDSRCFTTVLTVSFTIMKSSSTTSSRSSSIASSAMTNAVQQIVVATTISGQTNSSTEATIAMARLTKAITSNALQCDLRYYSRTAQPHARLDNVIVCHKAANNLAQCIQTRENNGGSNGEGLNGGGSNGNPPIEGQVTTTPGCTLDSNNWNTIYRRTPAFVGYVVWISILSFLWVCLFCIAAGPILFMRIDLWPPSRAWFPCVCPHFCGGHIPAPLSNVLKLQAARVKEGCLVAIMSALRLAYLIMLVTIAFQTKAPTFACVEFSFNRSNQPSVTTDGLLQPIEPTPYTTSGFELLQALFYPVFLLAVFGRQEWLDAEARYMGILLHTRRSRRDMVYCSIFRKTFSILALGFIVSLLVVMIVVLATKVSIDKSPLRAMARGSQISCALIAALLQVGHWKATRNLATEPRLAVLTVDCEQGGMNHITAPAASRELSYSEIVTGDTGIYSYTHPTRVKVFDPEAVRTGDKSSGKKGFERSEDSLSSLAAVDATTTAGGGNSGAVTGADDVPTIDKSHQRKDQKQQQNQLSRNTQNNASQSSPNNLRIKNKGYIELQKSREEDGVVGDTKVGGGGGDGGDSVEQGQGEAKRQGRGSGNHPHSNHHSTNPSNHSWKSKSSPQPDISPVDLSALLSTNLQRRLTPRGPMVHDSVTWGTSLALCMLFIITAIPAPLSVSVSAFVLYSFATRVMEIVVATLMLTPFTVHQPEPLRKKLAAKLKAVADEESNGDSLVSGSLHPNGSSLSQALLPTVMVNKSYDKSNDKSRPRAIDKDMDRRLSGDGGSPGLSSMTESMSNKNKHTFAQRPNTSINESTSVSALMRPLSSPFVSTTTSTTAGGGVGTGSAGTNIRAAANGSSNTGGSFEAEEEDSLKLPMEQSQSALLSSSMKRDGGLSVATGKRMSTDERSKVTVSFSSPLSTTMSSKISKVSASDYYDTAHRKWANHTYSPPPSPSQQLTQRRRSGSGDGSDSPLSPTPSSPRPFQDPRPAIVDMNNGKQIDMKPAAFGKSNSLLKSESPSYQPIEARRSSLKGNSNSPMDAWKPLNKRLYSKGTFVEGEYEK